MACLILKGPDGERRIAPQPDGNFLYTFRPGEKFDGSIDPTCGGEVGLLPMTDEAGMLLLELDHKLGKGGGDWLKVFFAPVAAVIGKHNCLACEVRRVIVNAYANLKAKRGRIIALYLMVRLWRLSLKKPDKAIVKLKEYLN